ncbi:MAG: 16S rRNA (guanine(527)-N(7))-methyltransferase RsmG [Candidatus Eremiobacteraeota bacterium]|nr:16S rRNA (guanine(527)-N(7))-methyltransferase RsmG [Candidatus Eremiobacteraeota bacterium]
MNAERPALAEARLERYVALVLERNAVQNLTAARTPDAVFEHVRDSLSVVPYVREPFVDVGSGGGFPGIPIAIATGYRGVLVESVVKKARFLEEVVRELALPLEVRVGRAEDAGRAPEMRERFASATARAVSSLPAVLELTIPFLSVGGLAVLQRGRLEARERTAAHDASLVLGATIEDDVALGGELDGRRIVLVRKVAPTGQRFPRRAGIPAKRPLCFEGGGDD